LILDANGMPAASELMADAHELAARSCDCIAVAQGLRECMLGAP
jgi:hypothetical protein